MHRPQRRTAATIGRARRTTAVALASVVGAMSVLLSSQPAQACDCPEPDPPEQAAEDAAAVFAGEVVATTTRGDNPADEDLIADVEVDDVWQGDVHERVEVSTPADQGLCGTDLEDGVAYLLYVRQDGDGDFVTDLCMRTTPLDQAQEDLAALGEPDEPLAGDATEDTTDGTATEGDATEDTTGGTAADGNAAISWFVVGAGVIALIGLASLGGWWWRHRKVRADGPA